MVIKRRDGSIYRLSGPNPVMKNQAIWDGNFKLHNLPCQPEKIADKPVPPPPVEKPKIEIPPPVQKKETELPPAPFVPIQPPPAVLPKPAFKGDTIFCLPADVEEKVDPVYREVFQQIIYREPFAFEGRILEETDMMISILCPLEVTFGSILFPRTPSRRWWRVQDFNKVTSVALALPSDFQPTFDSLIKQYVW